MIRYNEGPKKELELAPAPDNPAFPGKYYHLQY